MRKAAKVWPLRNRKRAAVPIDTTPKSAPRKSEQAGGTVVVTHVGFEVPHPALLLGEAARAAPAEPLQPCRTVVVHGTESAS